MQENPFLPLKCKFKFLENLSTKKILIELSQSVLFLRFKVVVRACYGAYFVKHIFKYLAPNFASGRPA